MRRNIVRYAVLAYVITLQRISLRVKRRFPTLQHIVDVGQWVTRSYILPKSFYFLLFDESKERVSFLETLILSTHSAIYGIERKIRMYVLKRSEEE